MKIDELWGIYSGEYKLLTNVPIAVASAMASSTIPVLSPCAGGKRPERNAEEDGKTPFVLL